MKEIRFATVTLLKGRTDTQATKEGNKLEVSSECPMCDWCPPVPDSVAGRAGPDGPM